MASVRKSVLWILLLAFVLTPCSCSKPTLADEILREDLNTGLQMGTAASELRIRSTLGALGNVTEPYGEPCRVEGQPGLLTYRLGGAVDICLLVDEEGLLSGVAIIPFFEVESDLPPGLTDITWDKLKHQAVAAARRDAVSRLDLATQRGISLGSPRLDVIMAYDQPYDEWSLSGATFIAYGDEESSIRFMLLNNVVATIQVGNRGMYRSVYGSFPTSTMARG